MNIRAGRYRATSRVTAGSASRFNVRDAAHLPDSDAGTDLAGCYRAMGGTTVRREVKRAMTVSSRTALIVLAVALFLCGSVIGVKWAAVSSAEARVRQMIISMERTRNDNLSLEKQVADVRDLSRIGYIAVTRLGMVASDDGNTVVMYVPQVEAYAGSVARDVSGEAVQETAEADRDIELNVRDNGRAVR